MYELNQRSFKYLRDTDVPISFWKPEHGILVTLESMKKVCFDRKPPRDIGAYLIPWNPDHDPQYKLRT